MNGLDFLIMAVFLGMIGGGFFSGVVKVSTSIIAIYAGTILAAAFYRPVGTWLTGFLTTMDDETAELASFFLLFVMFSGFLTFLLARVVSGVKLPRQVQILDNISGAVVAIAVSASALTVLAMFLTVADQVLNRVGSGNDSVLLSMLQNGIQGSELLPLFLRMAPFFISVLNPLFPGELPPILNNAV